MTVVVFLGPTLPVATARDLLDAVYLPPARQGDLLSAVSTYTPTAVALIDGEFGQSLSVWHKEILFAIESGVRVYGASSMGALRAAECAAFGMLGEGVIYRQFADGTLNDDDEVALAHAGPEDGHRPLSEPMVNVRATFAAAAVAGVIDEAAAARLTAIAKAVFFPERTFGRVFRDAAAAGEPSAVLAAAATFARTRYVDQKRLDAEALLRRLATTPEVPIAGCLSEAAPADASAVPFQLARTIFFRALYERDRTVRHDGVDVPLRSIGAYAALHLPDFADLNAHALDRALALVLAEVLGLEVTDAEVDDEARRFRARHRIGTDAGLADWLARNDLTPAEFRATAHDDALRRRLHRWLITRRFAERTTRLVLDELRSRGEYERVAGCAAAQERRFARCEPNPRQVIRPDISLTSLVVDHLRATPCRMDTDFATWAEEAGFGGLEDLQAELWRARTVREFEAALARELVDVLAVPDPACAVDARA